VLAMAACIPSSKGVLAAAHVLVDPADPVTGRGERVTGPARHPRRPAAAPVVAAAVATLSSAPAAMADNRSIDGIVLINHHSNHRQTEQRACGDSCSASAHSNTTPASSASPAVSAEYPGESYSPRHLDHSVSAG
jgi:hypothetical protein